MEDSQAVAHLGTGAWHDIAFPLHGLPGRSSLKEHQVFVMDKIQKPYSVLTSFLLNGLTQFCKDGTLPLKYASSQKVKGWWIVTMFVFHGIAH